MPTRQPTPTQTGASPGMSTLQLSGNTSSTDYILWTEDTQLLDGWWQRQWEFAADPFTLSSCGNITGSYILYHMNVTVNREVGLNTYASGLTVLHEIDYFSDSASGGWGTSGNLYTASAGYVRTSGTYGPSGLCQRTWDATGMYLPGTYILNDSGYPGHTDTSTTWNPAFNGTINQEAQQLCPNWKPWLVVI